MGHTVHQNRPANGNQQDDHQRPPHDPHEDDAEVLVAGRRAEEARQDGQREKEQCEGGQYPLEGPLAQQPAEDGNLK